MRNYRLGLLAAALLLPQWVTAQTQEPIVLPDREFASTGFPGLPVDLLPPGARALGLAGAFAAVADDATAAEANPAGLTILNQSEFSIHFRDSDYSVPFADPEALDPGFSFGGDTPAALIKTFEDSGSEVSFASWVKPFDRWTFSAFYQNQLAIDATAPTDDVTSDVFLDNYLNTNALSAEVDGYGISGAFRVNDMISLGLTIKNVDMEVQASESILIEDVLDIEFIFSDPELGPPLGTPAEFAAVIDDRLIGNSTLNGDDSDVVFNAGILINPNGAWSLGLVYKEGGSYSIPGVVNQQEILQCVGSGELTDFCNAVFALIPEVIDSLNGGRVVPGNQEIGIPDRLTFGLALRPSDTLLLSIDLNLVDYEDLPDPRLNSLGFRDNSLAGENISDELTYHVGVEKVFPLSGDLFNVFTVRAGIFEERDHDGFQILDTEDTHYTFGLGAVFRNLQLDLAYEASDAVDNIVLSGIYRFD
ncbi:MAG: outer membrane protein transport protein [Xanthomonadales bacterium]|nr:outer membrane protein transport protein [Xanthomonadales bacterium]